MGRIGRAFTIAKNRMLLRNRDFSIISNTCVGGVISHMVGEQFRSPTVNLIIYEEDFIQFCRHLREYMSCPMEPLTEEERREVQNLTYPVGILRGGSLPDIKVYFIHYFSFEEAKKKWDSRRTRINYDNLFLVMDRGMDAREEILDAFYALPQKNKVFLTHKTDVQRWQNNFAFSFYTPEKYESGCLYKKFHRGVFEHRWLDEFDYIHWLNTGKVRKSQIRIQ